MADDLRASPHHEVTAKEDLMVGVQESATGAVGDDLLAEALKGSARDVSRYLQRSLSNDALATVVGESRTASLIRLFRTELSHNERSLLRDGGLDLLRDLPRHINQGKDAAYADRLLYLLLAIDALGSSPRAVTLLNDAIAAAIDQGRIDMALAALNYLLETNPWVPIAKLAEFYDGLGPQSCLPVFTSMATQGPGRAVDWLSRHAQPDRFAQIVYASLGQIAPGQARDLTDASLALSATLRQQLISAADELADSRYGIALRRLLVEPDFTTTQASNLGTMNRVGDATESPGDHVSMGKHRDDKPIAEAAEGFEQLMKQIQMFSNADFPRNLRAIAAAEE